MPLFGKQRARAKWKSDTRRAANDEPRARESEPLCFWNRRAGKNDARRPRLTEFYYCHCDVVVCCVRISILRAKSKSRAVKIHKYCDNCTAPRRGAYWKFYINFASEMESVRLKVNAKIGLCFSTRRAARSLFSAGGFIFQLTNACVVKMCVRFSARSDGCSFLLLRPERVGGGLMRFACVHSSTW